MTALDIPRLFDELRREQFYGQVPFNQTQEEVSLLHTERTQPVSSNENRTGVDRDGC
jgi:hypothetical protein